MKWLTWSQNLPPGWKSKPLKSVVQYSVSGVDKKSEEGERAVRLCNYSDVYNNEFITASMPFMEATASEDEIANFSLLPGDVVITKDSESWDDIGIPALVRESAPDIVCGYHLAVLRPDPEVLLGEYLLRCLQSKAIRLQFELAANGVTRFGLPKGAIGSALVPVPPLQIQAQIVERLAQETRRVSESMESKQRQLELLAEKRRALITRAVTKGLNPSAPMRDSGITWLGDIPAHWKVASLRRLSSEAMMYGANEAAESDDENLPRFIRITDIDHDGQLRDDTFRSLPTEVAAPYLLSDGDVLLARSGATVGKSFLYRETMGPACFAGYMIRYRCDREKALPEFVKLFTDSEGYWQQINTFTIQATIQNFSAEKYSELQLAVPPIKEQRSIVETALSQCSRLDKLAAGIRRSIGLLGERRSAQITWAISRSWEDYSV